MKSLAVAALTLLGFCGNAFAGTPNPAENFELAPAERNTERKAVEVGRISPFARLSRGGTFAKAPLEPVAAWRGETVNVRIVVAAGEKDLEDLNYARTIVLTPIPAMKKKTSESQRKAEEIVATVSPVRWTLGQGNVQFADIVDLPGAETDVPAGTLREFLVTAKIPEGIAPGIYAGKFFVDAGGKKSVTVKIRVFPVKLPEPKDWAIHLDLWQHPQAVARWAGVKPWSKKHFEALVGPMTRLRDLGQKVVTCSIIEEPWNHQTFDDWESMVKWKRGANGTWKFDYTAFDAWVDFMMNKIGIDEQISCYSMLPWMMKIRYFDEATGTRKELALNINAPEFGEVWGAFLADFKKHLRKKGWLEKTCIALDERPDAQLNAARKVIENVAPELKIVSANDHPTRMSDVVYDISPTFTHSGGDVPALAVKRRAEGKKTTFYTCVYPAKPNSFTHSAPAEAHWLGFYAAANGFDGILRWAYNSWNKNPFETTAFGNWPAGDCFLIYPGNRTSMRLVHFRNGIEDFEKIRILRDAAAAPGASDELKIAVKNLDDYLRENFTVAHGGGSEHEAQVRRASDLLDSASMHLPRGKKNRGAKK
jgi:hypothetical protein